MADDVTISLDVGTYYIPEGARRVKVNVDTTSDWNTQRDLIGKRGEIYVYSDYIDKDGKQIPGIKIGDGKAYLIDSPFIAGNNEELLSHLQNKDIHVTSDEKDFWNNKVTCFISKGIDEAIVFTKEREE